MRQEQKLMVGIDQFTLKIYCNTSSSWNTMAKQVIDIFVEKAEFTLDVLFEVSARTKSYKKKDKNKIGLISDKN